MSQQWNSGQKRDTKVLERYFSASFFLEICTTARCLDYVLTILLYERVRLSISHGVMQS